MGECYRPPGCPPETFVRQVRDVLKHLYDFSYLQRHPLAQEDSASRPAAEPAGQRLRRDVITAIESLSPGTGVPFHMPQARLHNVLHLHYVEGLTVREVARELGISMRQMYRDLRKGEEVVAGILWTRYAARFGRQPPEDTQPSSIQAEIARLEPRFRPADISALVRRACEAVSRMAAHRSVTLTLEPTPDKMVASTDPVMAQQVLVNLISNTIRQTRSGSVRLELQRDGEQVVFSLRYVPEAGASVPALNPVAAQLAGKLGWRVEHKELPDGARAISISLATYGCTLLVIDDNEGLIELIERYLTGRPCRVVGALSGREGMRLAQELRPDAIILDVMMPEMDGWELLQRLRTSPRTSGIPIIICSVFNDPELAYSLGASLFLPKPVSRDDVLGALVRLKVL
ncbi:MAG: response regulator [Anaerolineae bacterium]|nr:response regulator [Anaerolineae bacterium]